MKKHSKSYFASCPVGFEPFLEEEILKISKNKAKTEIKRGGLFFECYNEDALEFLLTTRIASKVYKLFYSFDLFQEKDLYTQASQIHWDKIFSIEQSFSIKSLFLGRKHLYDSSLYSSQLLKDALVDSFRKIYGRRPNVDKEGDVHILFVTEQEEDHFKGFIYVALSQSLGNRHYRKNSYEFSLKENIAAGLLNFFHSTSENFFDPFCGSGTLLYEEIIRRYHIAPTYYSLLNNLVFPFEKLIFFQKDPYLKENFTKIKTRLLNHFHKVEKNFKNTFYGSDLLPSLQENYFPLPIHYQSHSFEKTPLSGDILCNIPYTNKELPLKLYTFLKKSSHQKGFICSLEQYDSVKKTDHFVFKFKNGPKDCVLFLIKDH